MIVEQDADEDQDEDVDGCCHLHDYHDHDHHDHHLHGEQRDDGKGRADSGS